MTSESSAWALVIAPLCDDPASTNQECLREAVLVHTDDGGRTWPAVPDAVN